MDYKLAITLLKTIDKLEGLEDLLQEHNGSYILAVGNKPYSASYRNYKLLQMTDGYHYGSIRHEYERMGKHILAIPAIIN